MKNPESFNPEAQGNSLLEKEMNRRKFTKWLFGFFIALFITKDLGSSDKSPKTQQEPNNPSSKETPKNNEPEKTKEINELEKLIEERIQYHIKKIYESNNYEDLVSSINRVNSYENQIQASSKQYNISPDHIKGLIFIESKGRKDAKNNSTNALGICQFTLQTAKECNLVNRTNPNDSIQAAAYYIRKNYLSSDADESLAFATFHAGPGNITKLVQLYNETKKIEKPITYPEIYKSAIENKNSKLYNFLFNILEDESSEYYFKILAAADIIKKQQNNPQAIKDSYNNLQEFALNK